MSFLLDEVFRIRVPRGWREKGEGVFLCNGHRVSVFKVKTVRKVGGGDN